MGTPTLSAREKGRCPHQGGKLEGEVTGSVLDVLSLKAEQR